MSSIKLRITWSDGRTDDRVFPPGRYVIGREAGDIALGDPNVSTRHAELEVVPGSATIRDLGSTNGTYDAAGARLAAPHALQANQPVRLGATLLTLLPMTTAGGTAVMPQVGMQPAPNAWQPPLAQQPPQAAPAPPPGGPQWSAPGAPPFGTPAPSPYAPPPQQGAPPAQPPYGAQPAQGYVPGPGQVYTPPPGQPYGAPAGAPPFATPYAAAAPAFALGPGTGGPPAPPAEWGTRAVGFIIDSIILGLVIGVLYGITFFLSFVVAEAGPGSRNAVSSAVSSLMCCMTFGVYPLALLGIGGFNRVYLVSKRGASIGQGIMKLKVVDTNGSLLSMGSAALRFLVQGGLSLVPLGGLLDLLWPLWDVNKQTLHDKAVNSFVVGNAGGQ